MSRTGRTFVVGQITNGERKGWTWLGIQDPNERSYDKLVAPLSGDVTHALIVGDVDDVREMIRMLEEQVEEFVDVVEESTRCRERRQTLCETCGGRGMVDYFDRQRLIEDEEPCPDCAVRA